MTIVFKVSDNIKPRIINYYKDKCKEKTPPYAVFQAMEEDTTVTLYESGKIMFQGTSADIDANLWIDMEKKLNKRVIEIDGTETKKKEYEDGFVDLSTIGSDEVGTGDYFGPVIVTASFVSTNDFDFLQELGVRDSKKITDDKIKEIAPKIMERIPHVTTILDNITYNEAQDKHANMNKIKAVLHNKVLYTLLHKDKYNYAKIIIDDFCGKENYFKYIDGIEERVDHITFMTKAEDKVLSVACSSIISRYIFLREMDKLSDYIHIPIPKGAGSVVDKVGKEILEKYGKEKLREVAKLNFKNTNKILDN